jgi:hypothetical protein
MHAESHEDGVALAVIVSNGKVGVYGEGGIGGGMMRNEECG